LGKTRRRLSALAPVGVQAAAASFDIEEQMGVPLYVLAYDHRGKHYKTIFTLYGNPAFNPGTSAYEHRCGSPMMRSTMTGRANFSEMHRLVVDGSCQRAALHDRPSPELAR
jgi:hypothetical protein